MSKRAATDTADPSKYPKTAAVPLTDVDALSEKTRAASIALWHDLCAPSNADAALERVTEANAPALIAALTDPNMPPLQLLPGAIERAIEHMAKAAIDLNGSLTNAFVVKMVTKIKSRSLVVLTLALKWHGYEALVQRIEAAASAAVGVNPNVRALLGASSTVLNRELWAAVYTTWAADAVWAAKCRERRPSIRSLPPWHGPPLDVEFDDVQAPERAEIADHVAALTKQPTEMRNAWAWIQFFWTLGAADAIDSIVWWAATIGDRSRIDWLVERGAFRQFATRTMLEAAAQKSEIAAAGSACGSLQFVAASLHLDPASPSADRRRLEAITTYTGCAGQLFQMALKARDRAMFDDVVALAPSLGPLTLVGDTLRHLVYAANVAQFDAYIRLPTIRIDVAWPAFVVAVTGKQDAEMQMFGHLLRAHQSWALRNRAQIQKDLEARSLTPYLCEFAGFLQAHCSADEARTAFQSVLDTLKRTTSTAAGGASLAPMCVLCSEPATRVLLCGHRISCETCINDVIKFERPPACPMCKRPVDTSTTWSVRVFD